MNPRALANPVVSLGLAIVLVGGTGVATAATGGSLILGRNNDAGGPTALRNTGAGSALHLGTANANVPPLTVGTNKTRVPYLNSDLVDGLDSSQLQRRVTGTCAGGAVQSVSATGAVTCASLPRKGRVSPAISSENTIISNVLFTFDGVDIRADCGRHGGDTPGTSVAVYATSAIPGGIVNGHSMETDGATTTMSGIGAPITTSNANGLIYAGSRMWVDGTYERATAIAMVDVGGKVTQVTVHAFLDVRSSALGTRPCTVWGTAI